MLPSDPGSPHLERPVIPRIQVRDIHPGIDTERAFPDYLQFLEFGEAGLTAIGNAYVATRFRAPGRPRDGIEGVIFPTSEIELRHISDGTSSTYLVGERNVGLGKPVDAERNQLPA
ncbi:MAG: DUF1559 domain-containing protein [Nitrospiraceae bacterium]|nr:DUF1559 domain-containing protein [Nitrospiraceae bacterium]